MSLIVASVQVPHPYHHSPYRTATLTDRSSGPDISGRSVKPRLQYSVGLESPSVDRPHRWSQTPESSESIVEESQMSGHGSASGPPPLDYAHEPTTSKASNLSAENVLPPLVYSKRETIMERHSAQRQGYSLGQPIAETVESKERRGPRLLGVHSILNPPHGEDEEKRPRRRGVSELEDDSKSKFTPPTTGIASNPSTTSTTTGNELSLTEASPLGQIPRNVRRILTPISPRLQRAVSYGRAVPGTIDATERPFLSDISRRNTPDHAPTNALPQLPPTTSQVTQQLPFIAPAAPSSTYVQQPRRPSVSVVGSTRPSPSPSFADSYSQSGISGQTSPSLHPHSGPLPGPTPPRSLGLSPSPRPGQLSHVPQGSRESEQGFHSPVVSSGQNYQLLTVDTTRGHMQLPVEVQAASRMADEKRKRNAGASARFRARRKEKEREAASKISNLETDLLWAQEDSRHYKAERDYLVEVILRNVPQYESLLQNRPASPRIGRMGLPRPSIPAMDSPLSMATDDYEPVESERPITRRRLEAYPYSTPSNEQAQHGYPPSPYTAYAPTVAPLPPPQQHASTQYTQPSNHAGGPPPPILARPPPGHELPKLDPGYERAWPPRTNGPP